MTLSEYLTRHQISDRDFASLIKVRPFAVYRYRRGWRRPCWAALKRITEVTGGAVTANDFAQ